MPLISIFDLDEAVRLRDSIEERKRVIRSLKLGPRITVFTSDSYGELDISSRMEQREIIEALVEALEMSLQILTQNLGKLGVDVNAMPGDEDLPE